MRGSLIALFCLAPSAIGSTIVNEKFSCSMDGAYQAGSAPCALSDGSGSPFGDAASATGVLPSLATMASALSISSSVSTKAFGRFISYAPIRYDQSSAAASIYWSFTGTTDGPTRPGEIFFFMSVSGTPLDLSDPIGAGDAFVSIGDYGCTGNSMHRDCTPVSGGYAPFTLGVPFTISMSEEARVTSSEGGGQVDAAASLFVEFFEADGTTPALFSDASTFLSATPLAASDTPEPGTGLLMAAALLAACWLGVRRARPLAWRH